MTVRLEQLLADATPGPWRVVSKHGKANYLPVVADERRLVVMPRAEDATLIALAPDMARLLIDMGDLLTGVLHDLDNGDDPGRGQKQAGRALLARLDALGKDTA